MITDEALVNLAFGIAAVTGIIAAAGLVFTAIGLGQVHSGQAQAIHESRSLLRLLYRLVMGPQKLDRFEIQFEDEQKLRFVNWLALQVTQSPESDLGDYRTFVTTTTPIFNRIAMYLNGDPARVGPKFELLRMIEMTGLDLAETTKTISWTRQADKKIRTSTIHLFIHTGLLLAFSTVTAFVSDIQSGIGIPDWVNVITGGVLVIALLLLVSRAGKHADLSILHGREEGQEG